VRHTVCEIETIHCLCPAVPQTYCCAAPVCSVSTNGNVVFSGCQGGVLKLWRMSDGQLADTCSLPDKASVTAIASLGPLLVSLAAPASTIG
jgi:hypothetical protein